ncbi:MAG: hypothetical protein GXO86_07590 [Chlorobi bacterium]|nr:hypothetical protein [Chlorobiota bacterium]
MKILPISILSIIIFTLISCNKADDSSNDGYKGYFPNSIGLQWQYERYDSLKNITDTINVTIISDTVISGKTYMIWDYDYNSSTERFYVLQNSDSIKIFKSSISRIDQLYIVPFHLYDNWINTDYSFDSSFVSAIQDITINNAKYKDVSLIERYRFALNDYLIERIWFKPYFGIIKKDIKHNILGPYRNETWELIE